MKDKPTEATKPGQEAAPAPAPTALYEVACHSIEIDSLICYRTHRLRLTKARADELNQHQPGSLVFVGI